METIYWIALPAFTIGVLVGLITGSYLRARAISHYLFHSGLSRKILAVFAFLLLAVGSYFCWKELTPFTFQSPPCLSTLNIPNPNAAWAVSPDGRALAVIWQPNVVRIINIETQEEKVMHSSAITPDSLAFTPDSNLLAIGGSPGQLWLLDLDTDSYRVKLNLGSVSVSHLAFSPDGKTIATKGEKHGDIQLWDILTRKKITVFGDKYFDGNPLTFTQDGQRLLAYSASDLVVLWDIEHKSQLGSYHVKSCGRRGLAFSPDQRIFASCANDGLWLWEFDSFDLLSHERTRWSANCLAFSPDGSLLALGCGSPSLLFKHDPGIVEIWDVRSKKVRARWRAHDIWTTQVAFCLGGKGLVTSDQSNELRIWDLSKILKDD